MKYGMSNSKTVWLVINFRIFRILSGHPVFTNSVYTVFTTMCAAMTMNFLNLRSECGVISCNYILHYYVCDCELVCEVVNYYHSLQLLVLLSFVYFFMYSCPVCWIIGYRMGRCVSVLLFVDRSFSTHIRSNWFVFDIP